MHLDDNCVFSYYNDMIFLHYLILFFINSLSIIIILNFQGIGLTWSYYDVNKDVGTLRLIKELRSSAFTETHVYLFGNRFSI